MYTNHGLMAFCLIGKKKAGKWCGLHWAVCTIHRVLQRHHLNSTDDPPKDRNSASIAAESFQSRYPKLEQFSYTVYSIVLTSRPHSLLIRPSYLSYRGLLSAATRQLP